MTTATIDRGAATMLTREGLAELSRAREEDMVLSVYLGRRSSDPGDRGAWRLRLGSALDEIRAGIERDVPDDLPYVWPASAVA